VLWWFETWLLVLVVRSNNCDLLFHFIRLGLGLSSCPGMLPMRSLIPWMQSLLLHAIPLVSAPS
jgi:hypothetical protein